MSGFLFLGEGEGGSYRMNEKASPSDRPIMTQRVREAMGAAPAEERLRMSVNGAIENALACKFCIISFGFNWVFPPQSSAR